MCSIFFVCVFRSILSFGVEMLLPQRVLMCVISSGTLEQQSSVTLDWTFHLEAGTGSPLDSQVIIPTPDLGIYYSVTGKIQQPKFYCSLAN